MIYFVQDTLTKTIKIGFARNPWTRLASLRSGCPSELRLLRVIPGEKDRERELHLRFAAQRLRREWFRPEGPLIEYIGVTACHQVAPPPTKRQQRTGLLAVWMNEAGETDVSLSPKVKISSAQLSRIRRGESLPTVASAKRLAAVTGIPAGVFVMGEAA